MLSLGLLAGPSELRAEMMELDSHLRDGSDGRNEFVCQRGQLREMCHVVKATSPSILLAGAVINPPALS